jgi:hypothetical protein
MNWYTFIITIPLILVLVALVVVVVRNLMHAWLDHRVKLALLDKLESRPELLRSFDELQELLDDSPREEDHSRQDFIITGVVLAVMGLLFVIRYGTYGAGRLAVGAYVGGVACVAIGFILAIVGLLTRFLAKTPVGPRNRRRWWWPFRSDDED